MSVGCVAVKLISTGVEISRREMPECSNLICCFEKSNYLFSNAKAKLTSTELGNKLQSLNVSTVILDVDYCAAPEALANAYLAIANAKPMLKGIKLNLSGSHKKSKCKNT